MERLIRDMVMNFIKWWDTPFALGLAGLAGWFLVPDCLKNVTGELITFFGIQSAVILPSMLFTAGLLGPEGLSVDEAHRYHKALGRQMAFWTVLLALDFLAVITLIIGKGLDWSLYIAVPNLELLYDASWLLLAIVTFVGTLALLRTIPFVRGIISLHELRGELLRKAIVARNTQEVVRKQEESADAPFKAPTNFGKVRKRPQ